MYSGSISIERKMRELTGNVNKLLWKTCGDLGIDSELLHERVYQEFGVESVKELSDRQALYLVDVLQGKDAHKPEGGADGRITEKQAWLIRRLERELGWSENPERLIGFIRKYANVESVDWLSCRSASAVIEGLKRLQKSQKEDDDNGEK